MTSISTKPWPMESECLLLRDACTPGRNKHALWNFMLYACGWHFRCLEPDQVYWLTHREHRVFVDWLERLLNKWYEGRLNKIRKRYRVMLWLFRGTGKSNLITKCVPLFQMLREPNLAAVIGSETQEKAAEFLAPVKTILDGSDKHSLFTWLYGNWYDPERDWSRGKITTAARTNTAVSEPSIGTFGVDTGITSKHPGLLIYDDPISEEKLKEGEKWIQAAVASHKSIFPALRNDSFYIFIGTRYRERDVIGTALAIDGIKSWSGHTPIEKVKRKGKWDVYFLQARNISDTANFRKGEPTLPELWDNDALLDYESTDPPGYASQMMGDATTGDHMEFTHAQAEKLFIPRKDLPSIYQATIHFDTAFKKEKERAKGDRNVITTWLHDLRPNGMVYLDNIFAEIKCESEDFHQEFLNIYHNLRARGIRIRGITDDKEMGGKEGTYEPFLMNLIRDAGLPAVEYIPLQRAGTRKFVRIRGALNYWLQGYVRLIDDCPNLEILIHEMTHINRSDKDDVADAAADVFIPSLWSPPERNHKDEQPKLPTQPGDDILKGRIMADYKNLEREIHARPTPGHSDDPQPYRDILERTSK